MIKKTVLVPNTSTSLPALADEVHGGDDLNKYKLAYLRNFKRMPSYHLK
jgi:hypothetical protein